MNKEPASHSDKDSQALLNQVILDYMKDQRRKQKWKWIFRLLILGLILVFFVLMFFSKEDHGLNLKPHVGLIDLNGEVFDNKGVNADDFAQGLDNAYKNPGLKAIILRINSPGGSPVQAEYIYNILRYYKNKYPAIPTYAVCVDICASAAYYIAVAADEIYASPASMVGSIGVLYNGFGFVDLMNKVGVSRRLQTAGSNKGFLDPFSKLQEAQSQKLQVMLDLIHKQFIHRVQEGRGARLKTHEDLFSGLIWTGEQALALGLIDGLASSGELLREKIKIESLVDYTRKPTFLDRMNKSLGTAMAEQLGFSMGSKSRIQELWN